MDLKPGIQPADEPEIRSVFAVAVNMTPGELAKWLKTEERGVVEFVRRGESESVGRQSGRRIVLVLKTAPADRTESDYVQMR